MVKLATGFPNTVIHDFFGIDNHQWVADIHNHAIQLLEEKAAGLLHGNSVHLWAERFAHCAGSIEKKLGEIAYGGLQFENFRVIGFLDCKFDETCCPGSGPAEDRQLAPQHKDAEPLQEAVYSGYVK